ncbi:MAG: cation transporter [Gammaproteobacteria bacterium]|jgi:cation diffusion facilitator family transporter|nr:cation transporter [Gammaproteobacteria bacterium]MBT3859102.1 cation transporter [Gammaproteobacteria bacterium]MBT3987102.1 cation transporter [Gammaproteobacteria bacterium]MBT4255199.1 cation transporter [Gammaproteobacteria bacterium]MBT4580521.1 cation transporter [Gammaproteobacteria bacterium]
MASSRKLVIYAALIGNSLIAVMKFAAALITGSSAMFSEGVHSVVDTGNQILLLYGLKQAQKPADKRFPFGHGKEIYFWSFVVAILIFAVGAGISIYEGIHSLTDPHPLENLQINYIVLGLAIIFEGAAWFFALKEFNQAKGDKGYIEAVQRGKDPSMFVVLFEDSAALLGLFVALIATYLTQVTGNLVFDGLASIIIGCILAGTAIWLAKETKGLLIGEAANNYVVDGIHKLAANIENIDHVNEVLTMHMGPDFILVNISVEFRDEATANDIEDAVTALDERIKAEYENVKRVFVEAEARHSIISQ